MAHSRTVVKMAPAPTRRYRGANIPLRVIRRYARAVAEFCRPDKIILFGSYAYGTPHEDSDVDLLVIMRARNQLDQAYRIRLAVPAPFPMDILVRTPHSMKWRLNDGESFMTEVVTKGKVLYEANDSGVGAKGGGRLAVRSTRSRQSTAAS
jgi:predicted nucleotidyltransferase